MHLFRRHERLDTPVKSETSFLLQLESLTNATTHPFLPVRRRGVAMHDGTSKRNVE